MAQLVVRNLNDEVKAKLQRRAREHGRSTEAEVRAILTSAVQDDGPLGLGSRIAARFQENGLKTEEEIAEQRGHPTRSLEFD
jgi:plasmid stability protein